MFSFRPLDDPERLRYLFGDEMYDEIEEKLVTARDLIFNT